MQFFLEVANHSNLIFLLLLSCSVPCYANHKGSENCKRPEISTSDDTKENEEAKRYFSEDTIESDKLKQLGSYFYFLIII